MKPELEKIEFEKSQQSFKYFKRTDEVFKSYWHYHPEYELTLIRNGEGTRFVGDSIANFSNYDLVLLGKNLPHNWVCVSCSGAQEAFVIQFNKDRFERFGELKPFMDLLSRSQKGLHFFNPNEAIIEQIISMEGLNPMGRLRAMIDLIDLLCSEQNVVELASEQYLKRSVPTTSHNKIGQTTDYIIKHIHEPLSVQRLADYTHMVPQSFCRWFKKNTGHSFVSFVQHTRIEIVCSALVSGNTPIQEIAFSTGFESISHFNRVFRKLKGMSPRAYRAGYLNGKLEVSLVSQT